MADRLTIARPYARAAFAEARGQERLEPWSEALRVAAEVVRTRASAGSWEIRT